MPYPRKNKWIGCVKRRGVRREKIFRIRHDALAWEAKQRAIPFANFAGRTDTEYLMGQWANDYLDYARKFTIKTYKEKKTVFRRFFKQVSPAMSAERFTPDQAQKFLMKQFEDRSGNAANKDRKNMLSAWGWGIKFKGMPAPNPFQLVENFPEKRTPRYIPPEADFWKVYELTTGADRVLLLCYLHLAARKNEIMLLTWDAVDFGEGQVRLATRKRRDGSMEYNWLPMTDDLYGALLDQRQSATTKWVFPNPETKEPYDNRRKWLKSLCEQAEVKPFGLHGIRHLTASILAQKGVPVIDIQEILRHKNINTTQRYLHQINSLRKALKVLSGGKKSVTEVRQKNSAEIY